MPLVQTRVRVFAFNRATAAPVTGDAANITAKWAKDYGVPAALTDINPTEAEDGFYYFDLTTAERDVSIIGEVFPESSTSGVQVIGVPAFFMVGSGGDGSSLPPMLPGVGYVPKRGSNTVWEVFIGETIAQVTWVYQADGSTPLNLQDKTLELIFERGNGLDVIILSQADLTIHGDDDNGFSFNYPEELTQKLGTRIWALRDAQAPNTVWLQGSLQVKRAAIRDIT